MNPSIFHVLTSLLCVFLMMSCVTSHLAQRQRDEGEGGVDQPQLVFGRRNMNPNMNSLFFGKRTYSASSSDKGRQRSTRVLQTGGSYTPNRNSLFFGKRQQALLSPTPSLTDLRIAVSVLNSYLSDLEEGLIEEE